MAARREVIVKSADGYRKASKKEKGQILDRITGVTGYNRDHASHLLTLFGKPLYLEGNRGARLILEADRRGNKVHRKRNRIYGREVADVVANTVEDDGLHLRQEACCGHSLAGPEA